MAKLAYTVEEMTDWTTAVLAEEPPIAPPPEPESDDELISIAKRTQGFLLGAEAELFGRLASLETSTPGVIKTLAGLPSPSRTDLKKLGITDPTSEDERKALAAGAQRLLAEQEIAAPKVSDKKLSKEKQREIASRARGGQESMERMVAQLPGGRLPEMNPFMALLGPVAADVAEYMQAQRSGDVQTQRNIADRVETYRGQGVKALPVPRPQPTIDEIDEAARESALAYEAPSKMFGTIEKRYRVGMDTGHQEAGQHLYDYWRSKRGLYSQAEVFARTGTFSTRQGKQELNLAELSDEDRELFNAFVGELTEEKERGHILGEIPEGLVRGGRRVARTAEKWLGEIESGALGLLRSDTMPIPKKYATTPLTEHRFERAAEAVRASKDPIEGWIGRAAEMAPGMLAMGASSLVGGPLAGVAAGTALEAPDIVADLEDAGVKPEIARPVGLLTGVAVGALEFMEFGHLAKGAQEAYKRAAADGIRKSAAAIAAKAVGRWAAETGEEGAQAAVASLGVDIGQWLDPSVFDPRVGPTVLRALQSGVEAMKESAGPMAVLGVAGMGVGQVAGRLATRPLVTPEMVESARERLAEARNRMSMGVDPSQYRDIGIVAAHWIESGIRKFGPWLKKMQEEFGEETTPTLKKVWKDLQPQRTAAQAYSKATKQPYEVIEIEQKSEALGKVLGQQFAKQEAARKVGGKAAVKDVGAARKNLVAYAETRLPPMEAQRITKAASKATTAKQLRGVAQRVINMEAKVRAEGVIREAQGDFVPMNMSQLNKMAFHHQAKGAKAGYRAGQLDLNSEMADVVRFAKENLPQEFPRFAHLFERITRMRTPGSKRVLIRAVNRMAENYERQSAVKEFKAALSEAKQQPLRPEFQKRIDEGMESFNLTQTKEDAMRRFEAILSAAELDDIGEIPQRLIDKARTELARREKRDVSRGERKKFEKRHKREMPSFVERPDKPLIRSMEPSTIRGITAAVQSIANQSSLKNRLLFTRKHGTARVAIANATGAVFARHVDPDTGKMPHEAGVEPSKKPQMGLFRWALGFAQQSLQTMVYRLSGEGNAAYDILVNGLQRGESDAIAMRFEARDFLRQALADIGLDDATLRQWSDVFGRTPVYVDVGLPSATSETGERVRNLKMTLDERVQILRHLADSSTRAEILKDSGDGIIFEDRQNAKAVKLRAADIRAIMASASAQEWALAEAMNGYVNGPLAQGFDAAWVPEHGFSIVTRDDYTPRRRHKEYIETDPNKALKTWKNKQLEHMGIFKERQGSNAPIVIRGAFKEFYEHSAKVSAYVGKSRPAQDAMRLLNDHGFQQMVRATYKHGDTWLDEMRKTVQQYAMPEGGDTVSKGVRKFIRRAHMGALGLKPHIVLYQLSSYVTASAEISPRYLFAPSVVAGDNNVTRAEMEQYSPRMRAREDGGGHSIVSPVAVDESLAEFYVGRKSIMEKVTLGPIHAADSQVMYRIWRGAKAEGQAQGLEGEGLMQYTASRAEEIAAKTQPTWDATTTSILARESGKNALLKLAATMFSSQRNKNFNIVVRALSEYTHSDQGVQDKARLAHKMALPTIVTAAILVGIEEAVRYPFRRKKDDEDKLANGVLRGLERIMGNWLIGGNVATEVKRAIEAGAKGSIDIFFRPRTNMLSQSSADLAEIFGRVALAVGQSITDAHYKTGAKAGEAKAGEEWLKAGEKALRLIGIGTGLPVSGALQLVPQSLRWQAPKIDPGDAVTGLLKRWNRDNPQDALAFGTPSRAFTIGGESYIFNDAEYARLVELTGDLIRERSKRAGLKDGTVASERTVKVLEKLARSARAAARQAVVAQAVKRLRSERGRQ